MVRKKFLGIIGAILSSLGFSYAQNQSYSSDTGFSGVTEIVGSDDISEDEKEYQEVCFEIQDVKIIQLSTNQSCEIRDFNPYNISRMGKLSPEMTNSLLNVTDGRFHQGEFKLILPMASYHSFEITDDEGNPYKFEETNFGAGLRYEISKDVSIEGGVYSDSFETESYWVGVNWMPAEFGVLNNVLTIKGGVSLIGTKKQMVLGEGKRVLIAPIPTLAFEGENRTFEIGIVPFAQADINRPHDVILTGKLVLNL